MRCIAVIVLAAFGLVACGGDSDVAATSPTASVSQPAGGSLFLVHHQTACCYSEGQISFLQVTSPAGDIVADRAYAALGSSVAVLDLPVNAGRYHVRSWERPCDGSCPPDPRSEQMLDPVTDECAVDVDIAQGERQERTIEFAPGKGCTIIVGAAAVTVPTSVSLRPDVLGCGTDFGFDDRTRTTAQDCLLDAFVHGKQAEAMSYEPSADPERPRFLITMTTTDGVVVFERADPDVDRWTRTQCSGLARGSDGHVTPTACEAPEPL